MADCTGIITGGFTTDCDNLPLGGLETSIVLINRSDIDLTATTIDGTNKTLMTNLSLKAGKTGYIIEGIKQSNSKNYSLVVKENTFDKFTHGIKGTIFNPTASIKDILNKMNGGRYVAVVEQKWKGASNAQAFEVLGFGSGLKLMVVTNASNENDNSVLIELQSEEGFEESRTPYTLLETDYATTKTAFTNLFVQAP